MSSTTRYSAQLKSILDAAFDSYTEKTGVELVKHPSGDKLQNCRSSEDVLQVLLEGRTTFKSFRDKLPKFLDGIRPVVNAVHTFSAVLGEAATLVRPR
jgi:fungal STAND N-terminal Goodbye domain